MLPYARHTLLHQLNYLTSAEFNVYLRILRRPELFQIDYRYVIVLGLLSGTSRAT